MPKLPSCFVFVEPLSVTNVALAKATVEAFGARSTTHIIRQGSHMAPTDFHDYNYNLDCVCDFYDFHKKKHK